MNLKEEKYSKYALVREMMETPSIVRSFDPRAAADFAANVKKSKGLFLTGEGSSRIFPAKRAITAAMRSNFSLPVLTEGSTQAEEYNLSDYSVFLASNSGQTKEVIRLATALKNKGHKSLYGLTANQGTKLGEIAGRTHVLTCGKEDAVAATKSVVEQGLFYDALLRNLAGEKMDGLDKLSKQVEEALTLKIDPQITDTIRKASIIYFAGRNNGAAEELALKTNEITRKKSAFLEGTFAVHGIEEVMDKSEVLIWIEPFQSELDKFNECLVKGVGMNIIAVSTKKTIFPTIIIPDAGQYAEYVQLTAGWNILVETGISLNINLDKPTRARKVGNEYIPE
ncbi:MAG TPA: SIS domain-containing protein [Bacteroidales bacterium]|jgi:glucosamine--fructose-6-phosphate aminotransferase (isomerizing)|nr:SIS domain-containing protein [Bacteroidales bacterium]